MVLEELIKVPSMDDIQAQVNWISSECTSIGLPLLQQLAERAARNRKELTYTPYSHYDVGVALLTVSGSIYDGANQEVASYTQTEHAEQAAKTVAMANGEHRKNGRQFIRAVAVSHTSETAPCGHCRQILIEHSPNDNALVLMVDVDGKIIGATSMQILLPFAFTPTELGI